jgi:hypothetical protein
LLNPKLLDRVVTTLEILSKMLPPWLQLQERLWTGIPVSFALAVPLELEASAATLELSAPLGTRVVVSAASRCAMVFLLCFNGLTKATSIADGHFKLVFPHDGTIFAASIFFFSRRLPAFARVLPSDIKFPFLHGLGKFISTRHGKRPIGHPRKLKKCGSIGPHYAHAQGNHRALP